MEIDVADAIRTGVRRTFARNGLLLVGIVYVLSVVPALFGPARTGPPAGVPGGSDLPIAVTPEPVIPVSATVAAGIAAAFGLLSLIVTVGALRIFLGEETERLPPEAFTRRIGIVLVNVVVGGLVFGLVVGVGFLLLIVPGIFLLVSLVFWTVAVVHEDANFVDGFRRSWELTGGHRLRIFLVGLVLVAVSVLVGIVFGLLDLALSALARPLGIVVGQLGGAVTSVFDAAVLAATYRQLTGRGTTDTIGGLAG
jgi:hypothetical protein